MRLSIWGFFLIILLQYSCATMFNPSIQKVRIVPLDSIQIIEVKDDIGVLTPVNGKYHIPVETKKINIQYLNQLDTMKIELKSRISEYFWLNLFANYGVGMIVDAVTKKYKSYYRELYLIKENELVKDNKNTMKLVLESGFSTYFGKDKNGNNLLVNSSLENVGVGMDFYYDYKKFVSFTANISQLSGYYNNTVYSETTSLNTSISVRNNHLINNFELGYGLSYTQLNIREYNMTIRTIEKYSSNKLGLSFIGSNQFSKVFGLALIYEPNMFDLNQQKVEWNHNIKLQFRFKIKLK